MYANHLLTRMRTENAIQIMRSTCEQIYPSLQSKSSQFGDDIQILFGSGKKLKEPLKFTFQVFLDVFIEMKFNGFYENITL